MHVMVTQSPESASRATAPAERVGRVDSYFHISARGSTVGREVRGGLVTFFTMAYIIALNPLIIGTAPDGAGNLLGGLPYADAAGNPISANIDTTITLVAGATALVAGVMTILMGVLGRFPIGIAAGLGINALLAFTIAPRMTWPQAMGLIVVEGVVIALLVLTGFRTAVFRAVPRSLRSGISIGIGLFIVFVGLVDGGIVRKPTGGAPVELGVNGSLLGWPMLVFVLGLFAVAVLHARRVRGALLVSIVGTTVVAVLIELAADAGAKSADNPTGWALNVPRLNGLASVPDLSLIGDVDVLGAFRPSFAGGFHPQLLIPLLLLVFSLLLADFFDTMGTVVAVGAEGDLLDEHGVPPHLNAVLMVDSVAAAAGGIGSVSSNTSYVESVAGVGEGARTGLASVVTGVGLPARDVPGSAGQHRPLRGRDPGPGLRRLPDDEPGPQDRLRRHRGGAAGVPHPGPDAVHVLDHHRHRRRLHQLRAAQGGPGQGPWPAPADVRRRRGVRRLLRLRGPQPAGRLRVTRRGRRADAAAPPRRP